MGGLETNASVDSPIKRKFASVGGGLKWKSRLHPVHVFKWNSPYEIFVDNQLTLRWGCRLKQYHYSFAARTHKAGLPIKALTKI